MRVVQKIVVLPTGEYNIDEIETSGKDNEQLGSKDNDNEHNNQAALELEIKSENAGGQNDSLDITDRTKNDQMVDIQSTKENGYALNDELKTDFKTQHDNIEVKSKSDKTSKIKCTNKKSIMPVRRSTRIANKMLLTIMIFCVMCFPTLNAQNMSLGWGAMIYEKEKIFLHEGTFHTIIMSNSTVEQDTQRILTNYKQFLSYCKQIPTWATTCGETLFNLNDQVSKAIFHLEKVSKKNLTGYVIEQAAILQIATHELKYYENFNAEIEKINPKIPVRRSRTRRSEKDRRLSCG
jgi:hypothetical protein